MQQQPPGGVSGGGQLGLGDGSSAVAVLSAMVVAYVCICRARKSQGSLVGSLVAVCVLDLQAAAGPSEYSS